MMNKKSKKSKKGIEENSSSQTTNGSATSSFTAFTSLRKSFKRLKRKKDQRAHSVDSILNTKENESKVSSSDKENGNIDQVNQNNILRRFTTGRRSKVKSKKSRNVSSTPDIYKFDVIEWSSCESLTDNFEKRMRKHNSLRRSKASLLMPSTGESQKISPPSTKITRYSSLNNILETKGKPMEPKWHSNLSRREAEKTER